MTINNFLLILNLSCKVHLTIHLIIQYLGKMIRKSQLLIFIAILSIAFQGCDPKQEKVRLARYVDPFIGTAGEGNVHPGALVPWGMVSLSPINVDFASPGYHPVGYEHGRPFIYGFSHVNLSGVGCRDMGSIQLMPTTGPVLIAAEDYKSGYSGEKASPGYYRATLDRYGVTAEMTTTLRSGVSRFTYPSAKGNLILNLFSSISDNKGAKVKFRSPTEVEGSKTDGNFCGMGASHQVYFAMKLEKSPSRYGIWKDTTLVQGMEAEGDHLGAYFTFDALDEQPLEVKVGISYVSTENAWENLHQEQGEDNFTTVRQAASAAWEQELRKIRVKGGTDRDKTVFYTALYHALIHPNVISDVNGQYPAMGENPATLQYPAGQNRYTVYSLWDTYRTVHPLLTLVYPDRQLDMVRTMIDMYKENGWLPKWELAGKETFVMVGDPAPPVITDTYVKGLTGFDVEAAFEAMKKGAIAHDPVNPLRPGLRHYLQYGYLPDDQQDEPLWGSVATTLEYGISDWNILELAKRLGKENEAEEFKPRVGFYKNLYDSSTQMLRPRLMDSSFLSPFDPTSIQGELEWTNSGGKGFVEGSSWQYTWFVPHDQHGLKTLMGGDSVYTAHLQRSFDEGYFELWNEPDMAYPFLFNYVKGEEWRTQKTVRENIDRHFNTFPHGLPGNDDTGTISAWLLFSMMGIYPDCPGKPLYQLTTPYFEEITLDLDDRFYPGEELVIRKEPGDHLFIDSIFWNGAVHSGYQVSHDQLTSGGVLNFHTQPLPDYDRLEAKIKGMVYGTLIGDAAGGPLEFKWPPRRSTISRQDTPLSAEDIKTLANKFKLGAYQQPVGLYNVWEKNALPGTVTDDSRWKLITINAIASNPYPDQQDFIKAIHAFQDSIPANYRGLNDKWLAETGLMLSGRLPKDRLWAGVPTLMGQMALSPVAALEPYRLSKAYELAWEINPFDQGQSLDINTAVIVGLARALQKDSNWPAIKTAMELTDPYHFRKVPWTQRRLQVWLDSAEHFVAESNGVVAEVFKRLETRMEARQWWDAWTPMVVVLSLAELTGYDPLATMQLCIEFGYDTDSYAQLAGAYFGALHGPGIFPQPMRDRVRTRLRTDYGRDPEDLAKMLSLGYQKRHGH